MANEFIARKGLIALENSQISGSLSVTNSVTASFFTGSYRGDGSQLTGIEGFPFTGSAGITGSLTVVGPVNATTFTGDGSQLTGIEGFPFTGSAKITGSLEVTGSVTATSFTGSLQGTATSASYVQLANVDGFTAYSASVNTAIDSVLDATTPLTATVNTTNSPFTVTSQSIVIIDSTNGDVTVNLPDLNAINGTPDQKPILLYKNDYSQNVVYVQPSGSQLVNGTTQDIIVSIQIAIAYNPTSAGWVTEGTSYQSLAELEMFFVPRTETGSFATTGSNQFSGSQAITGSLTVTEGIVGTTSTASYVEYTNVANKPALVSGSSQITYSGLTGIPSGILSGSAQIASFGIFATTGSNQFNGNQSITGSLTVSGQVVAQTLNVQQVTSSIVYSSGSNVFGNSLANTQQFTGSVGVTGSLTVNGTSAVVGSGTANYLPKFTAGSTIGNSLFYDDGTNVYIGATSGNGKLTINSPDENNLRLENGSELAIIRVLDGGALDIWSHGDSANEIQFRQGTSAGTVKMLLDASGNLGLGVTPSAWSVLVPTIQIGDRGGYVAAQNGTNVLRFGANHYFNGSSFIYTTTDRASYFETGEGQFKWFQEPSGTAGNAISFTQAMTLDASGRLGIGTTSPVGAESNDLVLQINGNSTAAMRSMLRFTNGNSGSTWGNGVFMTLDSTLDFYFYNLENAATIFGTSNIERMRITSGGDVGIGATSISEKLHLRDLGRGYVGLRLEGTAPYAGSDWTIYASSTAPNSANDFLGFYNNSATDGATADYKLRIFKTGRVAIQNPSPQGILEVGAVDANNTYGGHFFSTFTIPVNTWSTVFTAPNDNWAAITEFTWTSAADYNRSGAAYMRWAYNAGANALGVVWTLFNDSQNATATFRNSGGAIQINISGGAANYYVQVRIQGSKAA